MTLTPKINRSTLREQVRERLRVAIIEGDFPPGTRLGEAELAEQFGGGAAFERDVPRRIVMAGEQAPQFAVAQDRHRHRGADAHVLQIFDMDR